MSENRLAELRRKWIILYSVILFAIIIAIVFFSFAYVIDQEDSYSYIIVLLVLTGGYLGTHFYKVLKIKIPKYRLIKIVKCAKCGYVKAEKPMKGDYIFKEEGLCPRCHGTMRIVSIYKEKIS